MRKQIKIFSAYELDYNDIEEKVNEFLAELHNKNKLITYSHINIDMKCTNTRIIIKVECYEDDEDKNS